MNRNMKKLETMIPSALEAVSEYLEIKEKSNKVAKEYFGYAAQLGASIRTAGLLPTLAFYTDKHKSNENNAPRRLKLLQALGHILKKQYSLSIEDNLLEYAVTQQTDSEQAYQKLKQQILDASVALKLALRNFEKVETSK